eukprot:10463921-Alexandrium_andersonii.AAC.1
MAASGVGHSAWAVEDWARWRNGAWYSTQPTPAPADGSWQMTRAWGRSASADGAPGQGPDGSPP